MKASYVINFLAGAFFVSSAILLVLGLYTLSWPTTNAQVEYHELDVVYLGGSMAKYAPMRGTTTQTEPVDIQVTSYSYNVGGSYYTNSTVCYCWRVGISSTPKPPSESLISYFPANPAYSVLKSGPDFLLVLLLAICGGAIIYSWRMLTGFFAANA